MMEPTVAGIPVSAGACDGRVGACASACDGAAAGGCAGGPALASNMGGAGGGAGALPRAIAGAPSECVIGASGPGPA